MSLKVKWQQRRARLRRLALVKQQRKTADYWLQAGGPKRYYEIQPGGWEMP